MYMKGSKNDVEVIVRALERPGLVLGALQKPESGQDLVVPEKLPDRHPLVLDGIDEVGPAQLDVRGGHPKRLPEGKKKKPKKKNRMKRPESGRAHHRNACANQYAHRHTKKTQKNTKCARCTACGRRHGGDESISIKLKSGIPIHVHLDLSVVLAHLALDGSVVAAMVPIDTQANHTPPTKNDSQINSGP